MHRDVIASHSGGNPTALPLWMDVPSAEAPAFAGVTGIGAGMAGDGHPLRSRFAGTLVNSPSEMGRERVTLGEWTGDDASYNVWTEWQV